MTPQPKDMEKLKKEAREFLENVQKTGTCWLWIGGMREKGKYGRYKQKPAHRVAYSLFNGEIPEGMWVLHHCDVMNCVNPEHLYAGTPADNVRDTTERRGWNYGKDHWMNQNRDRFRGAGNNSAKLNEERVKKIRALAADGIIGVAIAKQFGVGNTTVYDIINNQSWIK